MDTIEKEADPRQLQEDLSAGRQDRVREQMEELTPSETVFVVSRLEEDDQIKLLEFLAPIDAAGVLQDLPTEQATDLMSALEPESAATIMEAMPSAEQADILGDMATVDAEAILGQMRREEAQQARVLLRYPDHVAGGLMTTEYLSYPATLTIGDVLLDLEKHRDTYYDYEVQYAYILDDRDRLVGVLRMRDLLLAQRSQPVREVMIPNPLSVHDHTPLQKLIEFFDDHSFLGVPAVNDAGALVGLVRRSLVMEAREQRGTTTFLRLSGIVGGEEFRTMPLWLRSVRRLSWLAPNIVLNMIAASVIAIYQDVLQAVIALAVFLPIISDMSGCSGNQAVAVSIRELSLGLIKPREFLRVFSKEAAVGMINGAVLGLLLGAVAVCWKGDWLLGAVVGGSLMLNTLLSVMLGGSVPLLLRHFKIDPALAAGPILTTVTDLCGFFFVLFFAQRMLT
ncbi:MAG: magnesium transporter [Verrucomicrobia bacterium]|nr:magnesium transporter [Verrucomicrobiota bacterium]